MSIIKKLSLYLFAAVLISPTSAFSMHVKDSEEVKTFDSSSFSEKIQIIFETEKTYVRILLREDLDDLKKILSDEHAVQMSHDEFSIQEIRKMIARTTQNVFEEKWEFLELGICLKDTDQLIGYFQIAKVEKESGIFKERYRKLGAKNDDLVFGYSLSKNYWGKKIMSEVTIAAVQFSLEKLRATRIFASVVSDNIGSQRVLAKSKFSKVETLNTVDPLKDENRTHKGRGITYDVFILGEINSVSQEEEIKEAPTADRYEIVDADLDIDLNALL